MHFKDFLDDAPSVDSKPFALMGQNDAENAEKERETSGFSFQPVGHGQVNFPEIFKAADEVGLRWAAVEQDSSPDRPAMDVAGMSIKYIKENYGIANK